MVVECLSGMHRALGLISSTVKENNNNNNNNTCTRKHVTLSPEGYTL